MYPGEQDKVTDFDLEIQAVAQEGLGVHRPRAEIVGKDFRVEPHAYGVFRAAAIPSTSLGSAGVCLGNTRALVACSKS